MSFSSSTFSQSQYDATEFNMAGDVGYQVFRGASLAGAESERGERNVYALGYSHFILHLVLCCEECF